MSHVGNTVDIETMTNSQIQQESPASKQTVSFQTGSPERVELEKLVQVLSDRLGDLPLDERGRAKAKAQISTIGAQLSDEEPNAAIIA